MREAARREAGAGGVAIRDMEGGYEYNPGPEAKIQAGDSLIVIARHVDMERLREALEKNTLLR